MSLSKTQVDRMRTADKPDGPHSPRTADVNVGLYRGPRGERKNERTVTTLDETQKYHVEYNHWYDVFVVVDQSGRTVHYSSSGAMAYLRAEELNLNA